MKKSLTVILGGALAFGAVAGAASAATPTDVQGTSYQSAVEELNALGVISGYTDGTFKPDNQITRAELAKIIVVASGNDSAATIMQNVKPSFSDVKTGAWYTGYINVAATKGLIQGDAGTKKYRPNDNIKFEEVVALLVRALGYSDKTLTGSWPYNYIVKAQDLGILDGVDLTKGELASRGVVAKLVDNTINLPTVTFDADGNAQQGPKLITKIGNASTSILTAPSLTDGKVNLNGTDVSVASNFVVTGGKALADLLGHEVTVVKNGSKVVALSDAQDADEVVTLNNDTTPDLVRYSTSSAVYGLTFDNSKSYNLIGSDEGTLYYYNNFDQKTVGVDSIGADVDATLFLNDAGKVRFVSAITYTNNGLFASYEAKTSAHAARILLSNNTVLNLTDDAVITLDGKAATAADLQANDVLKYIVKSGSTVTKVEATRKTATGKIEKVRDDGSNYFYTVAGVEYKNVIAGSHGSAAHAIGDEYTFFLNSDGQIAGEKAVSNTAGSNYIVLTDNVTTGDVVIDGVVHSGYKIVKAYSIKDNKAVTLYAPATTGTLADGAIATVTYNTDGTVASIADTGASALSGAPVTAVASNTITAGGTYLTNANTIYLNATEGSGDVYSATTADKITKGDSVAFVANATNSYNADIVVLVNDTESSAAVGDVFGTFVSKYSIATSSTTTNYYVDLNVNGEVKTFQVAGAGTVTASNKYDIVKLTDSVAPYNVFETASTPSTPVSVINNVYSDTNTFYFDANPYIATANTKFYVVDELNNVSVGSINDLYTAQAAPASYTVTFSTTSTTLGTFQEVGAVVIKKN